MSYKKISNENRKSTKFIIKDIPAYFADEDVSDEVANEVIKTIDSMPFNKFSIPLNAYRDDIFGEEGNHKCITVGFIKSYNADASTFTAIIFNAFKEAVDKMDKGIEINFGTYKGHLTRINRLALIDVSYEDEEVVSDEDTSTDDEEPAIEQTESAE